MPFWRKPGNEPVVDEYLRRQAMSADDYRAFIAGLKRKFPSQPFLIVRYGDHQPEFSPHILDPGLDEAGVGKKLENYDPRYYATYYAIDAINFEPVKSPAVMDTIDGPYLPLVIQEAAGIPLDPSFEEQKSIMLRCKGVFYACKDGAEARRFNRLLDRRRHGARVVKVSVVKAQRARHLEAFFSPPSAQRRGGVGGGGSVGRNRCFGECRATPHP